MRISTPLTRTIRQPVVVNVRSFRRRPSRKRNPKFAHLAPRLKAYRDSVRRNRRDQEDLKRAYIIGVASVAVVALLGFLFALSGRDPKIGPGMALFFYANFLGMGAAGMFVLADVFAGDNATMWTTLFGCLAIAGMILFIT